jgi:hypothetical protein
MIEGFCENMNTLNTYFPVHHNDHNYRIYDKRDELKSFGKDPFKLEQTIEKLKADLLLGFDVGGYCLTGNAWGSFTFNENSAYLYSLIKKCT